MRRKSIPFAILLVMLIVSFAPGQSSPQIRRSPSNVVTQDTRKRSTWLPLREYRRVTPAGWRNLFAGLVQHRSLLLRTMADRRCRRNVPEGAGDSGGPLPQSSLRARRGSGRVRATG